MKTGDDENRDASLQALDLYMREARQVEELTGEEETQLIERVQRGKVEREKARPNQWVMMLADRARDRLIEGYQHLVIGVAKKYVKCCRHLDMMDLIQEGNLALMRAVERHDPYKGFPFVVIAWTTVNKMVGHVVSERDAMVRVHSTILSQVRRVQRVGRQLGEQLEREPSPAEIAAVVGIAEMRVRQLLLYGHCREVESLHALIEKYGAEDVHEFVAVFEESWASGSFGQEMLEQAVQQALSRLSEKQASMVRLRYGLDGESYTQTEVARMCGTYHQAVQHAESRMRRELEKVLACRESGVAA